MIWIKFLGPIILIALLFGAGYVKGKKSAAAEWQAKLDAEHELLTTCEAHNAAFITAQAEAEKKAAVDKAIQTAADAENQTLADALARRDMQRGAAPLTGNCDSQVAQAIQQAAAVNAAHGRTP